MTRNVHGSPSDRRKIVTNGNLDLHERMENTSNVTIPEIIKHIFMIVWKILYYFKQKIIARYFTVEFIACVEVKHMTIGAHQAEDVKRKHILIRFLSYLWNDIIV